MNRHEVRDLLRDPLADGRKWTLQGFGMLRTYLDDERVRRLQVWDARYMVDGVSDIHDHPWDFSSTIIAGCLINRRYLDDGDDPYTSVLIRPGESGGPIEEPRSVLLDPQRVEVYTRGDTYTQEAHELHHTSYLDGTVTIITRKRVAQRDVAVSIWSGTGGWISAEPRPAAEDEVLDITRRSLERWF